MRTIERLAEILAKSDLTDSEIRTATLKISEEGWRHLLQLINEYRYGDREMVRDRGGRFVVSRMPKSSPGPSSVSMQVDSLLRGETGLLTSEAATLLLEELKAGGHNVGHFVSPARSKISFTDWVDKLLDFVPPKELLRIATIVRNRLVHRDRTDWPLKR